MDAKLGLSDATGICSVQRIEWLDSRLLLNGMFECGKVSIHFDINTWKRERREASAKERAKRGETWEERLISLALDSGGRQLENIHGAFFDETSWRYGILMPQEALQIKEVVEILNRYKCYKLEGDIVYANLEPWTFSKGDLEKALDVLEQNSSLDISFAELADEIYQVAPTLRKTDRSETPDEPGIITELAYAIGHFYELFRRTEKEKSERSTFNKRLGKLESRKTRIARSYSKFFRDFDKIMQEHRTKDGSEFLNQDAYRAIVEKQQLSPELPIFLRRIEAYLPRIKD